MEGRAASTVMRGQVHKRFSNRRLFVDELLRLIRADPAAVTQEGMAQVLGISSRTLSRWLEEFKVAWPPIDAKEWRELAREAAAQPAQADSWLITCRVTAASLSDAEAKLRPDNGIFILEARRIESVSVPAARWRVAPLDKP
jgi:hypothetical protein